MIVRAPFIRKIIDAHLDDFQKLYRNDYCVLMPSGWTRAWWRLPGVTGRLTPWRRHHACWPGPGRRPRVCTNCHSIHPEDAIGLLKLEWDVDATASCWTGEAALIPPHREFKWNLSRLFPKSPTAVATPEPDFFPAPMVHRRHFTLRQRDEFNSILFKWLAGKTSKVKDR